MLTLIFLIDIYLFGLSLINLANLKLYLEEKLSLGFIIGIIIFGYIHLGVGYIFGMGWTSFLLSLLFYNILIFFRFKSLINISRLDIRDFSIRLKVASWRSFLLIVTIFILLFSYLASQLITYSSNSYKVGLVHAYGDTYLHLGIINSFAKGDNFPVTNTIIANQKISYPFLVDFITAVFINPLGLQVDQAIQTTGVLLTTSLMIILFFFGLRLLKRKLAAVLFCFLFLFNGGLGALKAIEDIKQVNWNVARFLTAIPYDYTALKNLNYWWINVVISMLLPQRSFLLGLPLVLFILLLFWSLQKDFNYRQYLLAIFLYSLLPLVHTHSLLVVTPFLLYMGIKILTNNKKKILSILLPIVPAAMVVIFLTRTFLEQSAGILSLIHFHPGWMAGKENVYLFLIKNFNITLIIILPLILYGFYKKHQISALGIIAQLWMVIGCLFIFQPWDYDNVKIFVYWYLFSSLIISSYLAKLLDKKLGVLAGIIICIMTFSGALDIFRLSTRRLFNTPNIQYELHNSNDIEVADFIEKKTAKESIFLSPPIFNNPALTLAGRKLYLGFNGWLWTYGLDYSREERLASEMLMGVADKSKFIQNNINYILLPPGDGNEVNKEFFQNNFSLLYQKNGYFIYKVI